MSESQLLAFIEENCASLSLDSAEDRAVLAELLADHLEECQAYDDFDDYSSRGLHRSDF